MRPSSVRLIFLALLISTASIVLGSQERQIGGVGITVYSDTDFRGRNATFRQDTPDLQPFGLNDRISSLQVAPGEMWEACEHINYGGRCQVFSGTEPNLGRRGWGGMISSVRRIRGSGGGPRPPGRRALELYSVEGFEGDRRELTTAVADFRRIDFNDRAVSLRLPPASTWQICADINYVRCTVVNADWSDLGRLNMRNQISSARPWNQGGGGRGPVPPQRFRIILYEDRGFSGRSYTATQSVPLLSNFNDRASSARVDGGVWEICDDRDYGGRCVSISSDVSDLGSVGLRNRVSSVRLRGSPR